ncbi:ABC transporter permease [Candidatus Saccharibacteria bacterium]|nr:ABC transporter permease [Candidatus Saccharibacteria bacterium]
MFFHNYKYALKTLLKNKALVFWTLAFPFILAIFFNLAFARLHDYDQFEPFDIAIVRDDAYNNEQTFAAAFKTLTSGDERMFKAKYVDFDEADKMLDEEKVEGIVYVKDGQAHVKIKGNGTNQTVLKMTTEQVAQMSGMIDDIADAEQQRAGGTLNPIEVKMKAAEIVQNAQPKISDDSHVMNVVSIEFFTLIAMACMQGAMLSSEMLNRCLPNLSHRGKRVAIAPTKKSVVVLSNLLAGYTMLLGSVILLILFMRFVLGVDFGDNMGLIMLLASIGSLTATMFGMLLAVMFKMSDNAKQVVVLIITMVGCLFAGMFGGMKIFFDEACTWMNKINPVGLITDGFYSLLYYDDMTRFIVNALSLVALAAIFFVLSVRNLRRARYDSV